MDDDGGTFGIRNFDRVLELPSGRDPVAPPGRGRIRYNQATLAWESSIDGEHYVKFAGPGGPPETNLIFDPAGIGPVAPNVFSDWEKLYEQFLLVPGEVKIFFPGPASIPAGTYDMQRRGLMVGPFSEFGLPPVVSLEPGVVLENMAILESIELRQTGPDPSIVLVDDEQLILFKGARLSSTAGPVVSLEGSVTPAQVTLIFGGAITGASGGAPVAIPAGNQGLVVSLVISGVYDGSVSGPATAVLILVVDANQQVPPPPTLPGFAGTVVLNLFDDASLIGYSAAVGADWGGSPPATVAEALDRIAAALGPIP